MLQVADEHADMAAADITAVFIALVCFTGAVYPDRLDYVNDVLAACQEVRSGDNNVTSCCAVGLLVQR